MLRKTGWCEQPRSTDDQPQICCCGRRHRNVRRCLPIRYEANITAYLMLQWHMHTGRHTCQSLTLHPHANKVTSYASDIQSRNLYKNLAQVNLHKKLARLSRFLVQVLSSVNKIAVIVAWGVLLKIKSICCKFIC